MAWLSALFGVAMLAHLPDADSCRDAQDRYRRSLNTVAVAIKHYTTCLSESYGKDDCAIEFRRLRGAQAEYEEVVSQIASECS